MDDLSITKKMVFAFNPNYTLKEKQLNIYKTELGAFDRDGYEVDEALRVSREKLGDVLKQRQQTPETLVRPDSLVPPGTLVTPGQEEQSLAEPLPLSTITDEQFTEDFLNNIEDEKIMMEFIKKIGEKFSSLVFNEDSYDQLNSITNIILKTQEKLINTFKKQPLNDPSYNKLTTYFTEIFNFKNMNLTIKKQELLNKIKNVNLFIKYDKLNTTQRKRIIYDYSNIIEKIYPEYLKLYNDLKSEENTKVINALNKSGPGAGAIDQFIKPVLDQLNKEILNSGLSNDDVIRIQRITSELSKLRSMAREEVSTPTPEEASTPTPEENLLEETKKRYPNIDDSTIKQILELNNIANKGNFISTVNSNLNQTAQLLNNPINSLDYITQLENTKQLLSESIFLYETKFNQIKTNETNTGTVFTDEDNKIYSELKTFIKDINKQITQTKWGLFNEKYIEPVKRSTIQTGQTIRRGIVSGVTATYDFFKRGASATGRAASSAVSATGRAASSAVSATGRAAYSAASAVSNQTRKLRNSLGKRMTYKKDRTWSNWSRGRNTPVQPAQPTQPAQPVQPAQPTQTSTSTWTNPASWFRKGGTRKIKRSRSSKNTTKKR